MTVQPPRSPAARRRLERLVLLARGAIAWESAWRLLAALLAAIALFVAIAWLGLLVDRPAAVRLLAFVACLIAGAATVLRGPYAGVLAALRPGRRAALARIDRDSGFRHGEVSASEDSLASSADPAAAALWRVHQARLATALALARVGTPQPRLARFDTFAVRGAILLLLIAAAAVAGDDRGPRLAAALDPGGSSAGLSPSVRIDAWIDPPPYTGKPPIVLGAAETGDTAAPISAPVGSAIVVRSSEPAALDVTTKGAIEAAAPADPAKAGGTRRFVLRGDGSISYPRAAGGRAQFSIAAIPDHPPTIELTGPPKPNARASLTLEYRLRDDYGVVGAEADFSAPQIDDAPVSGRTLVAPPRIGLALPVGQNGLGDATTTTDLSDHPWAGARATLVLHARDEGGNEGASEPTIVQLPQRRFAKPLARALVEQRRNLVLDPDHRDRVSSALAGLMVAPEVFGTTPGIYLGLRVAAQRLAQARTDPALLEVADYLWQMALQIEDGDLSEAERDLRAAQKELRDAMQRGAPDEEIKKLTQDLRAAMDKFLAEMAQRQAHEDAERGDEPPQRGRTNRMVSRDDLQAMLDRMEEMARSGNLADAQRMLEQMQNILENLRTAKRARRNPRTQEMSRALDDLDALTREEQALRDDTFRDPPTAGRKSDRKTAKRRGNAQSKGQSQESANDQDADGDDGPDADNDTAQADARQRALQQRQKAIRDKLADLQRRMQGMRGRGGEDKLGDAGGAMKDAEDALDDEDAGGAEQGDGQQPGRSPGKAPGGKQRGAGRDAAVEAQGRALQAMREGAQGLAQQLQQQAQGQGQGEGQGDDAMADGDDGDGEPPAGQPRPADGEARDPLGRSTSRDPLYNPRARYDPLGTSPALRAQRVLEELRRRLGDTSRPQDEVDYLERLLRRY